jgi:hypothetical protein
VKRAEETAFAWSLVDAATPMLTPERRVWLCVKLGVGDQVEVINELLLVLACQGAGFPNELWAPLRAWVSGYLGSDSESRLLTLLGRLHVPEPPRPSVPKRLSAAEPFERRPRRVRQDCTCPAMPSPRLGSMVR